MPPPIGLSDLFKAGIHLVVENWLANGGQGTELQEGLAAAFGRGVPVSTQVLGEFISTVREGMEAATMLANGVPLKDLEAPYIPGASRTSIATIYGSVERLSPADLGGEQEPGTSIPFEIPIDLFIEEDELDDLINSRLPEEVKQNLIGSDRLRGNLKKYGHVRYRGEDETYDIYIRQVYIGEP